MTNVFLRLAVSCLVWAPAYVRAAGNPPTATCQAAGAGQVTTQTYVMDTLSVVRITCPATTAIANQGAANAEQGATANVFASDTAAATVQLNTILLGATYVRQNQHDDFTVSQLPTKPVSVYFRCNANGNPSCWIGVQVAAQPPLGPQGCTVGGSEVTLSVTAANQTAQFICATGMTVFPEAATAVYDSDCATEANLTTLLPGSEFKRADQAMNSLTVGTLPTATKSICFVCAANAGAQDNEKCKVKVNVSGQEPSKGNTVGLTARTATALGVLLVGAALSQYV